jgi:hypothetical protein
MDRLRIPDSPINLATLTCLSFPNLPQDLSHLPTLSAICTQFYFLSLLPLKLVNNLIRFPLFSSLWFAAQLEDSSITATLTLLQRRFQAGRCLAARRLQHQYSQVKEDKRQTEKEGIVREISPIYRQ